MRNLVLVLGDQLDSVSIAFDGFNSSEDAVLMIEAAGEASHVWSHRARIVLFVSAMRHHAEEARKRGLPLYYVRLDAADDTLASRLELKLARRRSRKMILAEPGEYRVLRDIKSACRKAEIPLAVRDNYQFFISVAEFRSWAGNRKEFRMERFYSFMHRKSGVLVNAQGPEGGRWNFDAENRA